MYFVLYKKSRSQLFLRSFTEAKTSKQIHEVALVLESRYMLLWDQTEGRIHKICAALDFCTHSYKYVKQLTLKLLAVLSFRLAIIMLHS